MKSPARFLLTAAVAMTVSACVLFKDGKPEEPKKTPQPDAPRLIGRIASVPADKRFVLIQSYENLKFETGTILTTRGPEERSANLLVTGESLGNFSAADVQSGLVEVGDAVYSHHVPKPTETTPDAATPTELPENQEKPKFENVQKNN